ncbi:hypothetical protein EG68_11737 [Paragonimus skrjabini miyazakii]|uniref:Uncharacterized protein n=1 Tax=Paragonimus skrjabini miyazakii TaxID=59628 RepID=A0A8S9YL16_9TREM|nr:hypothetical protein EG68_11737 [Paragonimus skrjabini miyazakii]
MFADHVAIPAAIRLPVLRRFNYGHPGTSRIRAWTGLSARHGRPSPGSGKPLLKVSTGCQTNHQAGIRSLADTQGLVATSLHEFCRSDRWGILPRVGQCTFQLA